MKRSRYQGILSIEMITAISLLAIFIGVIAALGNTFGKLNRHLWLRHTCIAAGQAQLDSVLVTGQPIDQARFSELWPDVLCSISRKDGEGQWLGLQRVEVHVSAANNAVSMQFSQYITKQNEVQP